MSGRPAALAHGSVMVACRAPGVDIYSSDGLAHHPYAQRLPWREAMEPTSPQGVPHAGSSIAEERYALRTNAQQSPCAPLRWLCQAIEAHRDRGGGLMKVLSFPIEQAMHFAVSVRLHRDTSPTDEVAFQRNTEDWLSRHELRAEGSQTTFVVLADRELTPIDQANALLAMLADQAVRQARVGPIVKEGDDLQPQLTGSYWIEADRYDLSVLAARVLYEAGRLDGDGFLDALGGYVLRASDVVGEDSEEQP